LFKKWLSWTLGEKCGSSITNSKFRMILRHSSDRSEYQELHTPLGVRLSELSNLALAAIAVRVKPTNVIATIHPNHQVQ
jgi:hypothetical protein